MYVYTIFICFSVGMFDFFHSILSKSIYLLGKLNSIELCLVLSHTDLHCWEDNVSIEFFDGPNNTKLCKTEINHGHGEVNLEWNGTELGNCSRVKFDMDKDDLRFNISADRGNESCKHPFAEDER